MNNLKYHQIGPGIKIGLPPELVPEQVQQRIEKFNAKRNNLHKTFNPKLKNFKV